MALLIFCFTGAQSQISLETSVSTMYDDNINNNSLQLTDKIATLGFKIGHGWEDERWSTLVFYDGTVNYFNTIIDRTNHFHSANVLYTRLFGDNDENVFNAGFSYGKGFNRGDYTFFDHSSFTVFANYKQFLGENILQKSGYAFQTISLTQLGNFSYSEHALYGNLSFALPTQTTVITQADLGVKYYLSSDSAASVRGSGKNKTSLLPDVTQLKGMIRVGQSITEGTGLSIMTQFQWNIQKQSRYLSSEYGVLSDDELFDDHYGYEGLHASLMLTQLITESMLLRITGGVQNKIYSSLSAYDLDGNPVADQRNDQRSYLNVVFQKEFEIGFSLTAGYDLIRNKSNDYTYDYWNNAMTLEFRMPF